MRLNKPRIVPLANAEIADEHRKMMDEHFRQGGIFNIFRTLLKAPQSL